MARVVFAALSAALAACAGGTDEVPVASGPGAAPGIVLLCLDTLRADALDATANAPRMPALAEFARDATVFEDASTPAPWTPPAVASMLTGLLPSGHGMRGVHNVPPLSSRIATLSGTLQKAGWSTAAIADGPWVVRSLGFARGYDFFGTGFDRFGPEAGIGRWAEERAKDRPFFLYLHSIAPHDPYGEKSQEAVEHPEERAEAERRVREILARAVADDDAPLAAGDLGRLSYALYTDPVFHEAFVRLVPQRLADPLTSAVQTWGESGWTADAGAAAVPAGLRAAYEGGLAWTDRVVSRTLAALAAAGLPDDTVVAIVGDHGEAFGEHGALRHGTTLFDEVLRVPLLLRAPGRLPAGTVSGSCSLVDVTPTLLELAGVPVPPALDGRSLLPLARGQEAGRAVVAEGDRPGRRDERVSAVRIASVRNEKAKYLVEWNPRSGKAFREALYDLESDPAETRPLPMENPGRFGADFCDAVLSLRRKLEGLLPAGEPSCGATLR